MLCVRPVVSMGSKCSLGLNLTVPKVLEISFCHKVGRLILGRSCHFYATYLT